MRRVAAIAVVHDTLSEGLNQNVDFDVVFDRVLMLDRRGVGRRTTRPCTRSRREVFGTLPSEYATPLALALTELVTNAVEHGLAGSAEGEVEIVAKRTDEIAQREGARLTGSGCRRARSAPGSARRSFARSSRVSSAARSTGTR